MKRRLRDESGMTLVELVVVSAITLIVVGALSNVFVSGLRAGSNTDAQLTAQENLGTALDRIEYEARCAQQAELLSGGAGVHLTFGTRCTNAAGVDSWCVVSGSLVRYDGQTTCTGTAQTFASNLTSATPFSCVTPDGTLPQLAVALVVSAGSTPGATVSATQTMTLRNADVTPGTNTCS